MTDLPPPSNITYCPQCLSKHNAGWIIGHEFKDKKDVCSSCGCPLKTGESLEM